MTGLGWVKIEDMILVKSISHLLYRNFISHCVVYITYNSPFIPLLSQLMLYNIFYVQGWVLGYGVQHTLYFFIPDIDFSCPHTSNTFADTTTKKNVTPLTPVLWMFTKGMSPNKTLFVLVWLFQRTVSTRGEGRTCWARSSDLPSQEGQVSRLPKLGSWKIGLDYILHYAVRP